MTVPTRADAARLRDVLEFVTAEPERWDQGSWYRVPDDVLRGLAEPGSDWTCGTSACLAGWAVLRAGWEPVVRDVGSEPYVDNETVRSAGDPAHRSVRELATTLLGLTSRQADYLFYSGNNLRDLWEFAAVFTDGAVTVPAAVRAAVEPLEFCADDVDEYHGLGER